MTNKIHTHCKPTFVNYIKPCKSYYKQAFICSLHVTSRASIYLFKEKEKKNLHDWLMMVQPWAALSVDKDWLFHVKYNSLCFSVFQRGIIHSAFIMYYSYFFGMKDEINHRYWYCSTVTFSDHSLVLLASFNIRQKSLLLVWTH